MTQKSSFFIAGRHAVIGALKNPNRRVIKIFLTEESKKNIHKLNPHKNLLKDINEIKVIEFDHNDVVRHPLVSKIIRAYQKKSTDDKS